MTPVASGSSLLWGRCAEKALNCFNDSAALAVQSFQKSQAYSLSRVLPAGQILEKLNGITSDQRMADRHFGDISYVQDMAWQVLTALDQAQRNLGGSQAGRLLVHSYCRIWQQDAPGCLACMLEAACRMPRRLLCQRCALPCHWLPRSTDVRADCR